MVLTNLEKFSLIGLGVAGIAGALVSFARRRRKSPEEIERARRLDLYRRGRVTSGQIVDLIMPETAQKPAQLVVYQYEVAGVSYEVAQDVVALPEIYEHAKQRAGCSVSLRYDPAQPSNSIVACEQWSGIPSSKAHQGVRVKTFAETPDP